MNGFWWSSGEHATADLIREVHPDEVKLRQLAETDETARGVLNDWLIENGIEVTT